MRVSQTPVLPDSLEIEVDEVAADVFGLDETGAPQRWEEVAKPGRRRPRPAGVHRRPRQRGRHLRRRRQRGHGCRAGFRNVRAVRYQAGGGPAGAIAAGTRLSALTAVPFVTGAVSPDAATGGADAEPVDAALRRGPAPDPGPRAGGHRRRLRPARPPGPGRRDRPRPRRRSASIPTSPAPPSPAWSACWWSRSGARRGHLCRTRASWTPSPATWSPDVAPAGVQVVVGAPRYELVRVEGRLVAEPDR